MCLFLLLADDEMHGPLKKQLDTNFLMGKQGYPIDALAAKRLMTDFVPTTNVVKHKRQESGPSNVAFVETKREGSDIPRAITVDNSILGGTRNAPT